MDRDFWISYCKISVYISMWICKDLTMKMKTVVLPQLWQAIRTLLRVRRSHKIWRIFAKEKKCYTNITGPSFFPSEMQGNKLSLFLPQQFKGVDMLIRKAIKPICIPCKLVFCNWFVLSFQTQIKLLMTRISLETKISQARFFAQVAEVKKYKLENNGYWAR